MVLSLNSEYLYFLMTIWRFSTILKFGFRHVMLEDNYKLGEGATPGDKAGFTVKGVSIEQ